MIPVNSQNLPGSRRGGCVAPTVCMTGGMKRPLSPRLARNATASAANRTGLLKTASFPTTRASAASRPALRHVRTNKLARLGATL